jgi:hypothetical protein
MFSQNKYIAILDSINKTPIQYCSFYSQNEEYAQHSDLNGKVLLFKSQNDTISISHTGYITKVISSSSIPDTLFLSRKIITLKTVKVRNFSKEINKGSFNYSKNNTMHYWVSSEFIRKVTINSADMYKIKSIFIPMNINSDYKDSCQCSVHLYRNNKENNLEDVLNTPIILKYNNIPKNFTFNIESQDIYLSDSILYIGLDCFFSIPDIVLQNYYSYDFFKSRSFSKNMRKSPIIFYFNSEQMRNDKKENVMFKRTRISRNKNNSEYKWDFSIFTAGLTLKTFE